MSGPVTLALTFGGATAVANLAGAAAVARSAKLGLKVIELLVAFSAGFMLALTLGVALPEALRVAPARGALVVLAGYLLVHLSQHTLTPHFHFGEETHHVTARAGGAALMGMLLHTFFDGVAIASGFQVGTALGTLFFVAIFLHKLPEGVTVSSLIVASGGTIRRAYEAAAVLGLATIAGVLFADWVPLFRTYGLPLASGVLLYVGASNLVPEFQHKRSWGITLAFLAGAVVFVAAEQLIRRVA